MNSELINAIADAKPLLAEMSDIKTGAHVAVHQRVKEGNKERIQIFEGMVIAVSPGEGANKTFTIRKMASGVGVEKVFPMGSPSIEKVDVKRQYKMRQAKPNFVRQLSGKALRFKEVKKTK